MLQVEGILTSCNGYGEMTRTLFTNETKVYEFCSHSCIIHSRIKPLKGNCVIHYAAHKGTPATLRWLLSVGANLHSKNMKVVEAQC